MSVKYPCRRAGYPSVMARVVLESEDRNLVFFPAYLLHLYIPIIEKDRCLDSVVHYGSSISGITW